MDELVDRVLFADRGEDRAVAAPACRGCGVDVDLEPGSVAGVVVLAPPSRAFRPGIDQDSSHGHCRKVPDIGPVDEEGRFLVLRVHGDS